MRIKIRLKLSKRQIAISHGNLAPFTTGKPKFSPFLYGQKRDELVHLASVVRQAIGKERAHFAYLQTEPHINQSELSRVSQNVFRLNLKMTSIRRELKQLHESVPVPLRKQLAVPLEDEDPVKVTPKIDPEALVVEQPKAPPAHEVLRMLGRGEQDMITEAFVSAGIDPAEATVEDVLTIVGRELDSSNHKLSMARSINDKHLARVATQHWGGLQVKIKRMLGRK